jgi:hypothetical protein
MISSVFWSCWGESQHFVAALDAPGMILQPRTANVCSCKIDGVQKFLNVASKLNTLESDGI